MPPKKISKATLASHIISSSEDEEDSSILATESSKNPAPNRATSVESSAIKKNRGRPRKPVASSQEPIEGAMIEPAAAIEPEKTKETGTARQAIQIGTKAKKSESRNSKKASKATDEFEDDDELAMEIDTPPKGKSSTKHKAVKASASKPKPKGVPNRKRAAAEGLEIPETQLVAENAPESSDGQLSDELSDDEDITPEKPKGSKTRGAAASSVDVDGLVDELAQLKLKYKKLRELKLDEADQIHEEEVQALHDRDRASQKIIENLKAELRSKALSFQQLQEKDKRIQRLEHENSLMEKKIEKLVQDHAILAAKLETARNQAKAPSNNTKAAPVVGGPIKEFSQHKDNLYADLCGLIVVNVKKDEDGGIEYDCLSTGKNGGTSGCLFRFICFGFEDDLADQVISAALHFKLQLDAEDDEDDEEDDEPYFTYNPILERGRDERLISILPPIFREEMNFRRTRGVDFYLQLLQSLQA
ncbi:hypothetical protein ABW19_dt0204221 [Dactylella cylindrospora]|nr:hypothetical protein ABW19_dt0204221 [Dactylella cylindrospora]